MWHMPEVDIRVLPGCFPCYILWPFLSINPEVADPQSFCAGLTGRPLQPLLSGIYVGIYVGIGDMTCPFASMAGALPTEPSP